MSDRKISANKTGTLFYTKLNEQNKGYRVRFRSFQQGMYQNKGLIDQLNQMQVNYNLFKYGKSGSRKYSQPVSLPKYTNKPNRNSKDKFKESYELKNRLKGMKETRLRLLDRMKSHKE